MFAKPLSLILVYIVTVFNIVVLALPLLVVITPFSTFNHNTLLIDVGVFYKIKIGFFILIFLISFLMLLYLFLDSLFGFSVRASLKNCVRHEKIKDYDYLSDIFDQVKNKFGERGARLYIKNSDEVNAYAISSLGSKAIVLTRGLINHYLLSCNDPKRFLYALRSIMAHEMSHLINKDFLPTFLIIVNQKVTNFVSHILRISLYSGSRISRFFPYVGKTISSFMIDIHTILHYLITFFNRFVVYNIYEFLRRFVSRSIEYRADRQAARAFGGQNMAFALSMLSENGYFTLFSTHPQTSKRMSAVQDIKSTDSAVRAGVIDSVANYCSLMFLLIICLYFAKRSHVDSMIRECVRNHEAIHRKLSLLWHLVSKVF